MLNHQDKVDLSPPVSCLGNREASEMRPSLHPLVLAHSRYRMESLVMNSVDKLEAGLTRLGCRRSMAMTADGWDGTLKFNSAQLTCFQQSFLEPLLWRGGMQL